MLRTRVPVDRLVDWIDQAVLDLRVKGGTDDDSDLQTLRLLGIRTATDLEDAFDKGAHADLNGQEPVPIEPDDFVVKMRTVLNVKHPDLPSVTVAIWKTLAREPNLFHVRHWKEMSKYLELTSGPMPEATEEAVSEQPLPEGAAVESLAR